MRTKTIVCVMAVVLAGIAIGFALFGLREANAVSAKLTAIHRKQSLLNADIRQEEEKLALATRNGQRLNPPPPRPQQKPRQPYNLGTALSQEKALLASNPQLRDLKAKSIRASVTQHFGLFYQIAGLSPEQIEKFEALVTAHEQASLDLNSAPTMTTGQQDEQFQFDEKELLGSAAYQQLQEYTRETVALDIVRQAAWYAQPTEPYSANQATQLMHILANASPSFQEGGNVVSIGSLDWNNVFAKAANVLSPAQLDSLYIPGAYGLLAQLTKTYTNQQPAK